MRRAFAFHIAGDQHLATVIHHGTNSWEDSGYSFCVPSIVNYYGRWWKPLEAPVAHSPTNPLLPYTGRYYDGFRNKVTMHAYANPAKGNHGAAGYGIIRFQKKTHKITMECWPRQVDVTDPNAKQHPGWPVTISQEDNYGRTAIEWLPTLKIKGQTNPVVQIIDETSGEIVYTLRIVGNSWQPKVFHRGEYTVRVGEGENVKEFKHVKSGKQGNHTLEVAF